MGVGHLLGEVVKAGALMISVQKGVPMPVVKPRGRRGTKYPIYPWKQMEVGDSFLFPNGVGRTSHAIVIGASKNGRKFKAVKTDDGYRCWRVE